MAVEQNDRPWIKLDFNHNTNELTVRWGPNEGPWGIFNEAHVNAPQTVSITEWWLYVGTKTKLDQDDNGDEPSKWEIFNCSVGANNEMTLDVSYVPVKKHKVLAQVIGYFDSKNILGDSFKEGIYSDIARTKLK